MTYSGLAEKQTWQFRDDLEDLYDSMPKEHRQTWDKYTWHLGRMTAREWPAFMPDFVIAPDGEPYIYRWYLFGNPHFHPEMKDLPGAALHIQVASDPERPLHDHPWDNTSHIIAGGYEEIIDPEPYNQTDAGRKRCATSVNGVYHRTDESYSQFRQRLQPGDVLHRKATTAHRLILPPDVQYTISFFTWGQKQRDWGFWYPDGWHHNREHVAIRDGVSVHVRRGDME